MGILDAPGYSRSQADTQFAAKNLITVDQLFANAAAAGKPVIIPHRGAGSLVAPENTLEAFRLGSSYGAGVIDGGDLWPLAGSTDDLAVNHNATIDYMTTLSGNIIDYTPMSYRNAPVDAGGPTGWFGGTWGLDPTATGGFRSLRSVTYDDLLREFGGRIVMAPEVKGTPGTPYLLKQIQRYGYQKSLLVQHFSASQLTQFTAIGCDTMWLSVNGTDATKDAVAATGTKYVCFAADTTLDATVSSWVADGRFTVGIYTINRHWQRDKYDALGCKFYFSDSPVYFTKDTTLYRTTRDTFTGGDYFHGHMSNLEGSVASGGRGYFETGGWLTIPSVVSAAADTGTERAVYLGYMAPAASASFTLDADVRYGTLPTDTTRYAGLVFACPTDKSFFRTNSDFGYTLILRVNGTLALTYYDGTLAVSGPTKATGAITAGTVAHLQVQVTPTQIIAKRTDAGSTDTTALTWAHGGTRGLYGPHVSRTDGSGGPMVVSFKNVIRT